MRHWLDFFGPNAGYIAEQYERYQRDPAAVEPGLRELFRTWRPPAPDEVPAPPPAPAPPGAPPSGAVSAPGFDPSLVVGAANLAQAVRTYGHLAARLDPLGSEPPGDPSLDPATHGIEERSLPALPGPVVGGPAGEVARNALEAMRLLRHTYCGTTGYEFEHLHDPEERQWLRQSVETGRFCRDCEPIDERRVLDRLIEVEAFERYLHRAFPGQTRFSIEGLDMLIPMLDEVVGIAAESGVCEVILAMAHRGRLNVLAHVLGKPYSLVLAEFEGFVQDRVAPAEGPTAGWRGDVKYHLGARKAFREGSAVTIVATLAPNPSHLEYINPVAAGMARASSDGREVRGVPRFFENATLPVIIHGDAAFTGQGVVAETLNLSRLNGYRTGGSIHIIANNQLGFTTEPRQYRSTLYASDLAKGFEIPVVHVNADDPPACIAALRLAAAYRQQFRKDVLVDLVGYRRWGHNEGDDPTFTQPVTYHQVEAHPTARELWASDMIKRGRVTEAEVEAGLAAVQQRLQEARAAAGQGQVEGVTDAPVLSAPARALGAAPASTLVRLNQELCRLPEGFNLNPRLARVLQRRCAALESGGPIDWAHAETLAFATILADGIPIRLTGQDCERGTFSQRHLVLYDQQTGERHVPLQRLAMARASFAVYNSPLTENAALGFEYGYSVHAPGTLVLWEAQYGDFANGAQVIIDQFITTGKVKWGQRPSLALLLPHGYEGQGPEHSSARPERFLQLVAEDNIRVANCATAAQYYHLLRWHASLLREDPRPLVVMTPKSLLRLPEAASELSELADGKFRPLIADPRPADAEGEVARLVLCSGKVYHDLARAAARAEHPEVLVARVELLYPFPEAEVERLLAAHPRLREVVWLQEEPRNMGYWGFVEPRLKKLLPAGVKLGYAGRPDRASPAEGSARWHAAEQARIVETAFAGAAELESSFRGARDAN